MSSGTRLLRAVRLLDEAVRVGPPPAESPKDVPGESAVPVSVQDPRDRALAEAEERHRGLEKALAEESARADAAVRALSDREKALAEERAAWQGGVEADAARLREKALREGHAEGMTKGRAEGEAAIRAELEAFYRDRFERAVSLVEKTVSGLDRARESLAALQEPQMVRLWEALLSRMLVTRVTLDPDTVLRTVAELLKRLSDRERVLVYLHPEDIARVEGRPELTDLLRGIKRLEYLADSHVDPGSVLIETNLGVYDARWRTQLEQVAAEVDHLLLTGGEDDGGERPA